ncbi:hypothetical protein MN608_06247 [Microdochium nivale]|nr:hypothetical protein MN608_06247 [Microdochium nivale]
MDIDFAPYQYRQLPALRSSSSSDSKMNSSHYQPGYAGPSGASTSYQQQPNGSRPDESPPFELFDWHPRFHSCLRYFLDHSQHDVSVQSLAAFINILLPCQLPQHPVFSYRMNASPSPMHAQSSRAAPISSHSLPNMISLIPYIRRLVVTGFDTPEILHGFFGDEWQGGIRPLHQTERRNYLFAAKSVNWLELKKQYDINDHGQVAPFLKPLQNVSETEIVDAEMRWSEWMAMQDWMVGPRAPDVARESAAVVIKREEP